MSFEYGLTEKQTFFLYISRLLPNIDIIYTLWDTYKQHQHRELLDYYETVSPFRVHPSGDDSYFKPLFGVDYDMVMYYLKPRICYLECIKMIGHTYFICKFTRDKHDIENCYSYYDSLLNEQQIKLLPLVKTHILNRVITYISPDEDVVDSMMDKIISYLMCIFNQYKYSKVLHAYPLAVDKNNILMKFE
jgi:hypothetical protein